MKPVCDQRCIAGAVLAKTSNAYVQNFIVGKYCVANAWNAPHLSYGIGGLQHGLAKACGTDSNK